MQFRFLNIPVYIENTFWIFALFFSDLYQDLSMESVIRVVVLLGSLLVHEYGHALTALYFGANPQIKLEAFGGHAEYNGYRIKKWQRFVITLNGPLLESLLIVISYFLLEWGYFAHSYYIGFFLWTTMKLNIFWCGLNLLPVVPLDGGRMLSYMFEGLSRDHGEKLTLFIGLITVVLVSPILYSRRIFFFATLLLIFGFQHVQRLQELRV